MRFEAIRTQAINRTTRVDPWQLAQ